MNMYKGKFFQMILRIIDWVNERRQEIYFVLSFFLISFAIGFGIYMFVHYMNHPMFSNPSTIPEHFARPVFIAMLSTVLIMLFGMFLIHFVTMVPFRRITFLKMEMEFDLKTQKEKQIANQFLFSSTMLHNHTENVRYVLDNELYELKQVVQFLTESYRNNVLKYNKEITLTMDVVDPEDLQSRDEKKLFQSIMNQRIIKTNTVYQNRLLTGDNVLVGVISVTEAERAAVVVRREYEHPFDIYDQETIEAILGYAAILFDTIITIQLLHENESSIP